MLLQRPLIVPLVIAATLVARGARGETNWPQWRGPTGQGVSEESVGVEWGDADVAWRAELPGRGHSSPVLWGNRVFLTSSAVDGSSRQVFAVNRQTGKLEWSHQAWEGEAEKTHKMNQFASSTCAVDGERVVAFFGHGGLHCYDLDGKRLWKRELGPFANPWGTASSPIFFGDLVVQNCESEEASFFLAVDKASGETAWKTNRDAVRGWSSPLVVNVAGRKELVINSERGVNAYDPFTGKNLWFSRGERGRGTPTVVERDGVVIAVSGRPGAMWATKAGSQGNVNETREVWRTVRKGGRDLGSPILIGDYLFVIAYRPGVASCYDLKTGKELGKKRLNGNVSASPIAANGHLYVPNEAGEVFVIKAAPSLDIVAKNQLSVGDDELFRASLAVADGHLYIRSDQALYKVKPR